MDGEQYKMTRENRETERKAIKRDGMNEGQDERRWKRQVFIHGMGAKRSLCRSQMKHFIKALSSEDCNVMSI